MAMLTFLCQDYTTYIYNSLTFEVTTQVGLSYSPMHDFPRCNQRE